jgi:hypothetical protein
MQVGRRKIPNHKQRKLSDPFYQTGEWRVLVELVWQRDEALCQECLRAGMYKPLTKPSKDINYQGHIDHMTPREQGGDDNMSNLELLCYKCHASKSTMERKPLLKGRTLINVVGNIASGKTYISTRLAIELGYEYQEINGMKQNLNECVVLEASGLGWKYQYIQKQFLHAVTVLCQCDDATTLERLQERERSGYVYPNNRLSPLQYYNNLKADLPYIHYDMVVDTEEKVYVSDIINQIRKM